LKGEGVLVHNLALRISYRLDDTPFVKTKVMQESEGGKHGEHSAGEVAARSEQAGRATGEQFERARLRFGTRVGLAIVLVGYCVICAVGITWGLPSRSIDRFLFPKGDVWNGEKIYRLSEAGTKLSSDALHSRGADVDVNPIGASGKPLVPLTGSESDVAKIYLRYRLYTYQPDEMITMMALSGMNPRQMKLDPRLYQYGGLYIYPVGVLIAAAGAIGWADVRSNVQYYLDHPDEFGKFYVIARMYTAAWGAVGVIAVYLVARRLSMVMDKRADDENSETGAIETLKHAGNAGLFAAILFAMMPIVVCMSHEAKPHLPGAVLMLLAVLFAMRCASWTSGNEIAEGLEQKPSPLPLSLGGRGIWVADSSLNRAAGSGQNNIRSRRREFVLLCVCCGAAMGMVLSSLPIFILIPLSAYCVRDRKETLSSVVWRTIIGCGIALGIYLLTNPYVVINLFVNRDVLRSNFGNSIAMYRVDRIGEGFVRVGQLMIEGARLPVLLMGTIGLVFALWRKWSRRVEVIALVAPALLLFIQFVLLGAGKPAEYGRFSIFIDTSLAIFAGCITAIRWRRARFPILRVIRMIMIARVGMVGAAYLWGFHLDATGQGSRIALAEELQRLQAESVVPIQIALPAEPAPYSCPPIDFAHTDVVLASNNSGRRKDAIGGKRIMVRTIDTTMESVGGSDAAAWWRRWVWRPTPISWANKPFVIERIDARPGASKD